MRRLLVMLLLSMGMSLAVHAADPEIAGSWVGSIDTNRGPMDIGLTVQSSDGKLSGVLKTGHGDWEVTSITAKNGQWTVAFKGAGNEGQMIGRIKDNKFSGDWKSKMANGTFELVRAKRQN
jgi:hypothetical protein